MKKIFYLLVGVLLVSCEQEPIQEPEIIEEKVEMQPVVADIFKEVPFAGQTLFVAEIDGIYVYQDDIIIPKQFTTPQIYKKGETPSLKSVGRKSGFWANNTVFYAVDSNLPNQARVTDAIKHWESNTNLKFVKRTTQSDYVYFTTGSGCSSYIGKVGGRQNITLATGCSTGNTIHEIGHAIGFWHEHSRVDRDNHVKINFENITAGREHNFKTYLQMGSDGQELTSSLDLGSIMMYGSYSFSKNGNPTIVKLNGETFSIQRSGLSPGDISGANKLYPVESEPEYDNKKFYTLYGMFVLRYDDRWWFYEHDKAWVEVELSNGVWYYSYETEN